MYSLSKKAEQNQLNTNYYVKLYNYSGEYYTITESYTLSEDCYLTTMTRLSKDNTNKLIFYKNQDDKTALTEFNGKKYKQDFNKMIGGHIIPVTYVSYGFWGILQYALIVGIDTGYCNGKKCYIIKNKSSQYYIDKESGMAIRYIEKSDKDSNMKNDVVVDYEYKFNVVKETDIVRPDETGYVEAE